MTVGRLLPAMALSLISGCGLQGTETKTALPTVEPDPNKPAAIAANPADVPSNSSKESLLSPKAVSIAAIYRLPADDGKKLTVEEVQSYLADPEVHQPIIPSLPAGFTNVASYIPRDNPITLAKAELGRLLYFDKRLSKDNTVSCASCHDPAKGWADAAPVSTGIAGQKGGRSAPTVMNRVFGKVQFWDGRAATLEEQALGPIQNPIEMGFSLPELVERLRGIEAYKLMFDKIFGGISAETVAKAIATFERTVIAGDSPNDFYTQAEQFLKMSADERAELDGDAKERAARLIADYESHRLSDAALRGRTLFFGKAECSLCHVGENLTDELFYNIGVGMDKPKPDEGRKDHTKSAADTGAFKTPSLRNVALTAPYMHDGSEKALLETVEYYDKGGVPNRWLHPRIKKLNLTKEEKADLVKFLEEGLTGPLPAIKPPRLP